MTQTDPLKPEAAQDKDAPELTTADVIAEAVAAATQEDETVAEDVPYPDSAPDAPSVEASPQQPEETPDGVEGAADVVAQLEQDKAELKDQLLRTMAEMENLRKRMVREREDAAKFAISGFAKDMLTVADNLQRALSSVTPEQRQESETLNTLMEGIEATEREMTRSFDRVGIVKIEALDKPLDPNVHEVLFEAEHNEKPPGTVFQVIEDGYMIKERLLRPARVGVTKSGASSSGINETA